MKSQILVAALGLISSATAAPSTSIEARVAGAPVGYGAGTTGGAGYLYQWQFSSDGVTYTDIAGATGAEYQHGIMNTPGTYYFLREVRTPNGCGPKLSNGGIPLEVVVNTIPTGTINISNGITSFHNTDARANEFGI